MQQLNSFIFKNLANAVSILGVLPICILFHEGGFQYLIPLIIYNNVMDDLDGILAGKLNIRSGVGATMDNVCDAIAHSIFVMVVGMYFGGICVAASLIGATAIVLRIVIRLDPGPAKNAGSPTNELIRHLFFVLVLAQLFELSAAPYVIVVFLLHAVSMLIPYKMPYLLRSMTKSALAIGLLNAALLVAWLVPNTAPFIAACFIVSYMYSLVTAFIQRSSTVSLDATSSGSMPSNSSSQYS